MVNNIKILSGKSIVVIACVFLLINILLGVFYYQNYQDKIDILAEMVAMKKESNIDVAVTILKGETISSEKGRKILSDYGYIERGNNLLWQEFHQECIITAGISFVLFGALILYLWFQQKRMGKEELKVLSQVEECLVKFREDSVIFTPLKGNHNTVDKLNHQLAALSCYLHIIKEQALTEKEETKGLVTDISHQLKTPVAALDTCITILLDSSLSEGERMEFTKRCRNALDGLEVLLESLLLISRLEAGMIQINAEKSLLLETIVTAVNRIYPKASENKIEVSFEYEDTMEQLSLIQDQKWLCEGIINVLDNAVKYSPTGSEIKINLQKRTSFVRIEISDQGIGIPKEEYHKVFQRFYRGTSKEVKKENGSGVGLYLAREIIEKHHGLISVASNYERRETRYPGSTFLIQLPLDE